MPKIRMADLFQIRDRFMRSVHLERDFSDSSALRGYIVTTQTKINLDRLTLSLAPNSGQRAWRITGDYGSGKSSFALVLAHLLSGRRQDLPEHLKHVVDFRKLGVSKPQLIPVLVTGVRGAIAASLLHSLRLSLENIIRGKSPGVLQKVKSLIETAANSSVPETAVIEVLQDANDYVVSSGKGTGLLIILDELGKFLEFASLHPDRQDIYFLQTLAEVAARSGKAPLLFLGLLHQGFNVYADQLSQPTQREWEKVAGRFEELLFNPPIGQIAILVADALNVHMNRLPRDVANKAKSEMASVLELGWFGAGAAGKSLLANAPRLYPLHPTVLPVLIKLFSRFGQNERSIFSFLMSDEPFALKSFSSQFIGPNCFYRIHNLYDYARATFGYRLSVQSYRSHWNQIESMIESFPIEDEVELQVLKTIGLLNLLDVDSLLPSDTAIELAVGGGIPAERNRVRRAVAKLQKAKHVLYNRGVAGGYCLWPHTSVNLQKAYTEALKVLGTPQSIAALIENQLHTRPIVARRHYIKTGNLRHFEIQYISVANLSSVLEANPLSADGRIVIPLCETEEERLSAIKFAGSEALKDHSVLLVAVPKPLMSLEGPVQEARRWEWIGQNVPELNHDYYAADEVSRQVAASRQVLQKRLQSLVGLRQFTEKMELHWFYLGESLRVKNGRELLSVLSDICDKVYNRAPRIHNELINRRSPSSAAAAARMRLIERMFKYSLDPLLGMDPAKKPPEMSMYLSVLQESRLHRETEDGFRILEPHEQEDPCHLRPALRRILEILEAEPDARVRISDLFDQLRRPPYGIRDGLHAMLLAAFVIIHEHEIAFYENEAFVRHVSGEDFRRVMKAPESFEAQLCRISGIRSVLFEQLLNILELSLSDKRRADVLDVVRPLCIFAAQLPAYTHKTKRLNGHGIAVRNALLSARDPIALIFRDLPKACGFAAFDIREGANTAEALEFVSALKISLDELKAAFPELLEKMKSVILKAFDLPGPFQKAKDLLRNVANGMLVAIKEPQLKAFCLRLADANLLEAQWLESLGSFVCSKPPSRWVDEDADLFYEELNRLAQRFKRVESMTFATKGTAQGPAVRVAITRQDGTEVERVVCIDPDEEGFASEIENDIAHILQKSKRVGLAAASRAIWKELSRSLDGADN
jgi:hypothetical protein